MENRYPRWARTDHNPVSVFDPDEDRFEELNGTGTALAIDENIAHRE